VTDFTVLPRVITAIEFRGKTYSIERLTPNGLLELQAALREIDRAAAAQPVAFRYRYHDGGKWIFADKPVEGWTPESYEQQPLYATPPAAPEPIDMVLHCPACGLQHIDAPEDERIEPIYEGPDVADEVVVGWDNPPHRSHLCHGCGHIWRPADVPTNGVAAIKTRGNADSEKPAAPETVHSPTFRKLWDASPVTEQQTPAAPEPLTARVAELAASYERMGNAAENTLTDETRVALRVVVADLRSALAGALVPLAPLTSEQVWKNTKIMACNAKACLVLVWGAIFGWVCRGAHERSKERA